MCSLMFVWAGESLNKGYLKAMGDRDDVFMCLFLGLWRGQRAYLIELKTDMVRLLFVCEFMRG